MYDTVMFPLSGSLTIGLTNLTDGIAFLFYSLFVAFRLSMFMRNRCRMFLRHEEKHFVLDSRKFVIILAE